MARAVVHSDREALYVFKLKFHDNDNTLPNMIENGEVGLHTRYDVARMLTLWRPAALTTNVDLMRAPAWPVMQSGAQQ